MQYPSVAPKNRALVVLGAQWGDEGKGKIVDVLSKDIDIVARCQGGSNAGHTIKVGSSVYKFHLLPSGLVYEHTICVVGNGVVIHLPSFFNEIDDMENPQDGGTPLKLEGRILVSDRAHLVLDYHQWEDGVREKALGKTAIGTTKRGIGPSLSSKANRTGIRVADLYDFEGFERKLRLNLANKERRFQERFEHPDSYRGAPEGPIDADKEVERYRVFAERLKPHVVDTVDFMYTALSSGKRVLIEGANAAMLDIDYGTYPFVTSSNCTLGGCFTGLGIPHTAVGQVIGVAKAYTTRVGGGPFPTECINSPSSPFYSPPDADGKTQYHDLVGQHMEQVGHEIGTSTGRTRRCGWLDLVVVQYTTRINGYTELNLTKLDILSNIPGGIIKLAVGYNHKGTLLRSFPASLQILEECEVVYEEFPTWTEDISSVRAYSDLPIQARNYVERIESFVGVPVRWIGVGPERVATIIH
mmetsp:Transcript_8305/g.17810  ORF Transcript_8305/g.17810 Transcript_8305/m.17810 type:complete len:470 (-) Transcript_8305:333-1742(-)